MCFSKIIEYLQKTDPEAYEVLNQIESYETRLFDSSLNVLSHMTQILEESKQQQVQ